MKEDFMGIEFIGECSVNKLHYFEMNVDDCNEFNRMLIYHAVTTFQKIPLEICEKYNETIPTNKILRREKINEGGVI